MTGKNGEICTVKESGLTLKGDPDVVKEATRFESILKEAFGVQKNQSFLDSMLHSGRAALGALGVEENYLDNEVNPIFRKSVYEQVAQDFAHDSSAPASIRKGPIAPFLAIENKAQPTAAAALPDLDIIMSDTKCQR